MNGPERRAKHHHGQGDSENHLSSQRGPRSNPQACHWPKIQRAASNRSPVAPKWTLGVQCTTGLAGHPPGALVYTCSLPDLKWHYEGFALRYLQPRQPHSARCSSPAGPHRGPGH